MTRRPTITRTMEPLEPRLLMAVHAVLNNDDGGAGSLRQAIASAADGDTIDLSGRTGTIALATRLWVDKSLTFVGPGAGNLTLSGRNVNQVMYIAEVTESVVIRDLTIADGRNGDSLGGGGINSAARELLLERVIIRDNRGTGWGGGISAHRNVTMTDCRITGNLVTPDFGEFANGGGLWFSGTSAVITNCTFDNNTAAGNGDLEGHATGGGAHFWNGNVTVKNSTFASNTAVGGGVNAETGQPHRGAGGGLHAVHTTLLTMVHCTIVDNYADQGGGFNTSHAELQLVNNLIAGNSALPDWGLPQATIVFATPTGGGNVMEYNLGATWNTIEELPQGAAVGRGALANHGGITPTVRVAAGVVRDRGILTDDVPLLDQRGLARDDDDAPDVGAIEYQPISVQPVVGLPASVLAGEALSFTVAATSGEGGSISITGSTLPEWLTLLDHGDGTATLSGSPINALPSDNTITLRFSDGMIEVEQTIVIPVVNHAPAFVNAPPTTTPYFDTAYSFGFQAEDDDGDPLTITAIGLPHWLKLIQQGNGFATLSGVPTDSFASSHPITVRVSDGQLVTEQSFTLSVHMERFRLDEHGTLTVMGTVGRDVIQVWVREGSQLRAVVNGTIRNYPLSSVTGLTIYGLDENDSISVNTRTIPAYVLGGGGNDTLTGGDQRDFFIGGGGHDRLFGSGGDDRLSGLAGNDYMEGGSGQDVLTGGDGHDYLIGQSGMDRLYGDNGNDTLLAKDKGYDILHGGDGDDLATWDPNDLLHELFATPA